MKLSVVWLSAVKTCYHKAIVCTDLQIIGSFDPSSLYFVRCKMNPSDVCPFLLQILSPLLDLNQNRSKLKLYISHLTSLCQERDPIILQDFAPPPAYHRSDSASWHTQLQSMTREQVSLCVCTERQGGEQYKYTCICVRVFVCVRERVNMEYIFVTPILSFPISFWLCVCVLSLLDVMPVWVWVIVLAVCVSL